MDKSNFANKSKLSVDEKLEYLVHGYIKNDVSFSNNKYPLALLNIIAVFIGNCLFGQWDTKYISFRHTLNNKCIKHTKESGWATSFGSIIADHGTYHWTI